MKELILRLGAYIAIALGIYLGALAIGIYLGVIFYPETGTVQKTVEFNYDVSLPTTIPSEIQISKKCNCDCCRPK